MDIRASPAMVQWIEAAVGDFNEPGALNLIKAVRQPDLPSRCSMMQRLPGSVGAVGVASLVGELDRGGPVVIRAVVVAPRQAPAARPGPQPSVEAGRAYAASPPPSRRPMLGVDTSIIGRTASSHWTDG